MELLYSCIIDHYDNNNNKINISYLTTLQLSGQGSSVTFRVKHLYGEKNMA